MTSIVSDISKQFGKALILSTFLPSLIFVILSLLLVGQVAPDDWGLLRSLEVLDPQWQVLAVSLASVMLSGMLYNLNIPLIRFYEGYTWREGPLGQRRTRHYQGRFLSALERIAALDAEWRGLDTNAPSADAEKARIQRERNQIRRRLYSEFPQEKDSVLPTRLGNVIRSFEDYPQRQYRIASITLWPRLVATIDKDYAATIDDAKISFDFMVNSSALSALLALIVLGVGLRYAPPSAYLGVWVPWLLAVLVSMAAARLFYLAAVSRAMAWGATVRAAFDLYRRDLLKQLGFSQVPATLEEERALWRNISLQAIYGDAPSRADLRFANPVPAQTSAAGQPGGALLEIARGVKLHNSDDVLTIVLGVRNAECEPVEGVVVHDTPLEGYDYEWGSACIDTTNVPVSGTDSYRFAIGTVLPGQEVVLTYRLIPRIQR